MKRIVVVVLIYNIGLNVGIDQQFTNLSQRVWRRVQRWQQMRDFPRPTISLDSDLRNYNAGGSRYVQRNEGGIRNREGSP